jgi:hypothetical protein
MGSFTGFNKPLFELLPDIFPPYFSEVERLLWIKFSERARLINGK